MAAIVSYAIWSCLGTCTEHRIEQNIDCALQKTQCMTINNCRGSRILPMKSTSIMTESLCKGGISVSPRQGSNSSEDPHKIWHKLNPNKRGWTLHQVTMYLFYNEFFSFGSTCILTCSKHSESGVKWFRYNCSTKTCTLQVVLHLKGLWTCKLINSSQLWRGEGI